MNTAPSSAPGFLAALAPIIRLQGSSIEITEEDGELHVAIAVEGHDVMEAAGPPASLDAQLPAAIEKFANWINASAAQKGSVKIDFPRAMAAQHAKANPAPARKKPAPKKKRVAKPAAPKRAAPRRSPPKRRAAAKHQVSRADKTECIDDYRALKAKHGAKLTRRLFVDNAKTGRRYEKLWANSWPAFVKEAEGSKSAPATKTPAKPAAAAATPKKKDPKPAPKASKPAKDDKRPWTVKAKGKTIGATIFEKKPGDTFTHSSGTFTVQSIDAEKREIYVESVKPGEAKDWDSLFPTKSPAKPAPSAEVKKPPYAIKSADGKTHGATIEQHKIGDKWGMADRWEIVAVDHEKREYTVKDLTAPAATEAQPASKEPA